MFSRSLAAFLALPLFFVSAFGESCSEIQSQQFYFGPEFLDLKINTKLSNIRIKGKKDLVGLRFGYEYLKSWAFYAGADLLSVVGSHALHASQNGSSIHISDQGIGLSNLDLRFGYTTAVKKMLFTPFLGTGIYTFGSVPLNRGFNEGWVYFSGGLRSKFPLSNVFSLGINLKVYKAFASVEEFKNHNVSVKTYPLPWGGDIGFPFIWNFNSAGTWTFQAEPYWLNLDFSSTQRGFGSKFLIEVHF